ncbi:hypothetical protein PVT68_15665 [Microbulbifer bruguierae]|uniref:Uncharacterized protein n=1 Tax=Microbulbifer bruguierae TaxID=3029061 RepID=A0ABY8NC80_9GAMM|nr:hypothetical protein [Microbulbifer bruguierae]WGL16197.1 hypothetical protein PVT68_15665 [Microbulbifer bruguierae]
MEINDIENHGYIRLIEFAIARKRFTKKEAYSSCGISNTDFDFIKHQIFSLSAAQESYISEEEEYEWKLSPEAFFNYLQFQEFKHAVKSSKQAKWIAIASIAISGVLALASIFTSFNA